MSDISMSEQCKHCDEIVAAYDVCEDGYCCACCKKICGGEDAHEDG